MDKHVSYISVNLDKLKLDLKGKNAYKYLRELNQLLDKLQAQPDFESVDYRLEQELSQDLLMNKHVIKLLQVYTQIYPEFLSARASIEHQKIVELEHQLVRSSVESGEIKKAVKKLFLDVPIAEVKNAVVLVKGSVSKSTMSQVVDHISQMIPQAEVSPVFVKDERLKTHTVVESVFFGEF